ncbi:hypothetical protein, partial [Cypionkella sp.]|uniref:hypothetical protein n=1 Tax=Cypionkella sp. TaxID=2811411 RepID=UPI002602DD24
VQLAGLKFGLSATAGVEEGGINPGLRLNGTGLLNPGSKDTIAALQQTADVVDRQTAEAACWSWWDNTMPMHACSATKPHLAMTWR